MVTDLEHLFPELTASELAYVHPIPTVPVLADIRVTIREPRHGAHRCVVRRGTRIQWFLTVEASAACRAIRAQRFLALSRRLSCPT